MAKRRKIPRAGFIPYYVDDGEIYVMLMKPSDPKFGGNEFQIAKGHIDPGEDSKTAALREANEELGLLESNLVSVEYLGQYLGYTQIYYGRVKNRNDFTEPMFETGETTWITVSEFHTIGRAIHIPILDMLLHMVTKKD